MRVIGITILYVVITVVVVLALALVVSTTRALVIVGTAEQVIGIALAALPDLERWARQTMLELRELVRAAPGAARRLRSRIYRRWHRYSERLFNFIRRLRGRPQHHTAFVGGHMTGGGTLTATLRRGGTLEERLLRVENEVARYPGMWREDFQRARDERVLLRWYGVVLALLGTLVLGIASW